MPARIPMRSSGKPFIVGLALVLGGLYVASLLFQPSRAERLQRAERNIDPFTEGLPGLPPDRRTSLLDIKRQARTAAREGYVEELKGIIRQGLEVDSDLGLRHTLLMVACENGKVECARYLIREGARVDAQDGEGYTPIFLAARNGSPAVVDLLLKAAPNLNIDGPIKVPSPSRQGQWTHVSQWILVSQTTPLLTAAAYGHNDLTVYLLEHGASVDRTIGAWGTPLRLAVNYWHPDVARSLIAHGASVNIVDPAGHSLLWYARSSAKDMGGHQMRNPEDSGSGQVTPEEVAQNRKIAPEMIDLLVKAGATERDGEQR
jgi:hypothetical protein